MQELELKPRYNFTKTAAQVHEFYISGEIKEPLEYTEWFDIIRNAGEDDTVKLYINSGGGSVDTAVQFMHVLRTTQAFVVCAVEGACMSAATMIFLQGHALEISEHSLFMFHNYAGGVFGKGGELYDQISFERAWSRQLLEDVYRDFLTTAEINQMLDNKDIWLSGDEVKKRAVALAELRNTQAEAAAAATAEIATWNWTLFMA